MTQIELIKKGIITEPIKFVSQTENIDIDILSKNIINGLAVIPYNPLHRNIKKPCGIGKDLRIKVNANIGTSTDFYDPDYELKKLKVAISSGADTIMDLSVGIDINKILSKFIDICDVPLGTVPIYQAAAEALQNNCAIVSIETEDIFRVIEEQAKQGVDFMTVHCGIRLSTIERLKKQSRITDIVSRGGALILGWMIHNERENPLYEHYDRLLDIAQKYDVTLSLGDGLRPGSIADASDRIQVEELLNIGELVDRARKANVQVIVEGPGHVPLNQIEANVVLQKKVCHGAPFYVLGPLVTDIAAGYDHIAAAIGGAIAGAAGADFLCYVTPAEHLSLPDIDDVRQGVIASKIAAHAADIVRLGDKATHLDVEMSIARRNFDWNKQIGISLNPDKIRKIHERFPSKGKACSMCGDYCAMALVEKYLGITIKTCE